MDNVGCHGNEAKLIDCAYHRDTSEYRHSGDIWIECDTTSTPEPDIKENSKRSGDNNENGSQDGLAVALVDLVIAIMITFALVGYIILTKHKGIFKHVR